MSIIYSLVSRSSKIILSDYTEYSGNFQQISQIILNKIKKEKKCSIDYNNYVFYYDDEEDITYLCMGENLTEDTAFTYLAEIKKRFLKKYDMKIINSSYAYGLKEFNEELKTLAKYYEENPAKSRSQSLLDSLNDTTDILRESVEKMLERNEKLNIIAQKSKNLKNTSNDMRISVRKLY